MGKTRNIDSCKQYMGEISMKKNYPISKLNYLSVVNYK